MESMDWIPVRKSIKWLIGIPVSMVLEDLAVNVANSASKPRFLSFFSRSSCLISLSLSLSLSFFLSRYSISPFLLPIKPPFHHFPFFLLRFLLPRFLSLGLIQFNFCRSRESISNELGCETCAEMTATRLVQGSFLRDLLGANATLCLTYIHLGDLVSFR